MTDKGARTYNPYEKGWMEGDPTDIWIEEAHPEDVEEILAAPINDDDEVGFPPDRSARSPWFWMRFPNGDLLLGFWPQGDAYFVGEARRDV